MDALSEILRVIKLDSAIYLNGEFSEPWCVSSPNSCSLAPVLSRHAGHIIIYHLLCEGRATAYLHDGSSVPLVAGDLITFPHGHAHTLGGGPHIPPVDVCEMLPSILKNGLGVMRAGGGGGQSRFICGYLVCDPQLSEGFLGGLPAFLRISIREDDAGRWLENTLRFSVTQAGNHEVGAGAMVAKLSEVLFVETLRRFARDLPGEQTGWLGGARDAEIGKALALLHQRTTRAWTLAELAHAVGLSRTVLTQRFRHFLGEPPIAYHTRWRLQLGARALTTTSQSVAEIALDSGYESEAAFNRAFKRQYGQPPARYRKDKNAERAQERPAEALV